MPDSNLFHELTQFDDGRDAVLDATEHGTSVLWSDTVLAVDRWGRRRGEELAEEYHALVGHEAGLEFDPAVTADSHASLFEPAPTLADNPTDAARAAWFKQLMETPEYASLRSQTVLDTTMSGLAAKSLCDQWAEYEHSLPPPGTEKTPPGSDEESIADQIARMRSTTKALESAAETVSTAQDMAAGLGMGDAGGKLDSAKLAAYFKRVRSDQTLRRILEFAGRAIRRCRALQRTKTTANRGELTGIELAGDVARLVPWELAQISGAVPELETLALYRLAQRRSLCYRQRRVEPQSAGPIIVTIDESGSMRGGKVIAAKGLGLALAWLARQQKRWCALVAFSGGSGYRIMPMPPHGSDQTALIKWLEGFIGGGNNCDIPIGAEELPAYHRALGAPKGKVDVIMITDAILVADEATRAPYLAWATEEQVQTFGLAIGCQDAGDFGKICSRHWCIPNIDLDNAAIQEVLSI